MNFGTENEALQHLNRYNTCSFGALLGAKYSPRIRRLEGWAGQGGHSTLGPKKQETDWRPFFDLQIPTQHVMFYFFFHGP